MTDLFGSAPNAGFLNWFYESADEYTAPAEPVETHVNAASRVGGKVSCANRRLQRKAIQAAGGHAT
jgi:hypothetical protein